MIRYGIANKNRQLITHVEPLNTGMFRAHTDGHSVKLFEAKEEAEKYYRWNHMKKPFRVVKLRIEIEEDEE